MFRRKNEEEEDLSFSDIDKSELTAEERKWVEEMEAAEAGLIMPGYPGKGPLTCLLVMGFPSDRIFTVYNAGSQYYFYPVGKEMTGVDWSQVPEHMPTRSELEEKKKALIFNKAEMLEPSLTRRKSVSTTLDNCGIFSFLYAGKKQRYILLGQPTERQITDFLGDIHVRFPKKTEKELRAEEEQREIAKAEKELLASRDNNVLKKCKILGRALSVLSVISFFCMYVLYIPFLPLAAADLLLFLISVGLCLAKPNYFSVIVGEKKEAAKAYGTEVTEMFIPAILSGCALMLLAFNEISFVSLIQAGIAMLVLCLVLSAMLFIRCTKPKKNILTFLICMFVTGCAAVGIIMMADLVLDSGIPVSETECVIEMVTTDDASIGVDYNGSCHYITYRAEDEGSFAEGDAVTVYQYRGGIGLPYLDIY